MNQMYTVKPGDTLNKISDSLEIQMNMILKNNELNDLILYENQLILVPIPHYTSIKLLEYRTKKNQSIKDISEQFNVSPHEIKYFNNVYNLILEPNQEIHYEHTRVSRGIVIDFENI